MSDLICRRTMRRCDTSGMCSPYGGCQPAHSAKEKLESLTEKDFKIITLEATVAQQAQMIEHLRGGPTPGYTAVDMATAAAQGFRDGVASMEPLRKALSDCTASLEGEALQKYHGQKPDDMHPVTRRDYDRDMAEIEGYKALSKEG